MDSCSNTQFGILYIPDSFLNAHKREPVQCQLESNQQCQSFLVSSLCKYSCFELFGRKGITVAGRFHVPLGKTKITGVRFTGNAFSVFLLEI